MSAQCNMVVSFYLAVKATKAFVYNVAAFKVKTNIVSPRPLIVFHCNSRCIAGGRLASDMESLCGLEQAVQPPFVCRGLSSENCCILPSQQT